MSVRSTGLRARGPQRDTRGFKPGVSRPATMTLPLVGLLVASLLTWVALGGLEAEAQSPQPKPAGQQRIVIHRPHPEQFDLAFDEVLLDWSGEPRAKARAPAVSVATVPGSAVLESAATRALLRLSGVATRADLLGVAASLKIANPGAEIQLVLYPAQGRRSPATRRLLSREVELLLPEHVDPSAVLVGVRAGAVRQVQGVPGGYVVEVADPLMALDVADALRQDPRVRSAAPGVKRQQFRR